MVIPPRLFHMFSSPQTVADYTPCAVTAFFGDPILPASGKTSRRLMQACPFGTKSSSSQARRMNLLSRVPVKNVTVAMVIAPLAKQPELYYSHLMAQAIFLRKTLRRRSASHRNCLGA